MSSVVPVFATPTPHVRRIPLDQPWRWLERGWNDLIRAPRVSLTYGLGLTAVSFVLTLGLLLSGWIVLLLPLAAGFALVAPLLGIGLYDTSRRLALGEPVSLRTAITAWRANPAQIVAMGAILMLLHLAWVRLATLLFALFFSASHPGLGELVETIFFSSMSLPFLVVGTVIGGVLAFVAFAIAVVSLPMLLDRQVDVVTAMATSVTAVRHNLRPLALWAALIVIFTVVGIASLYIGLALALPLVGHASWHAYKDLVE